MVLEEASSPRDSFTSSDAPPTDADQYYGDRSPTELSTRNSSYVSLPHGVHVNVSHLPKPIFADQHPPQLYSAITQSAQQAQTALGRPITQEEADALAFHFTKSVRIASYGAPIGAGLAGALCYRGASKFRFPGWTPNPEKFNFDKFVMLTGKRAKFMWHFTRFNAYMLVGTIMGQTFFGSYALTVATAGRAMDGRLKELMDALQAQAKLKSGTGLPGGRQVDDSPGKRNSQGETFDMARQRSRAQEAWKTRQQQQSGSSGNDDMSPTGGAFGAEFVDVAGSDTAMMSDDQARRQTEGIQRQQEASYAKSQQSASSPQKRQEPRQDAFTSQEESKPTQGGSAWERLRQQATSGKPVQPTTRSPAPVARRDTSSTSDSFSFSSSDEDRQLAKAEAQKDFDSRIERERSGKDFEDKKRW